MAKTLRMAGWVLAATVLALGSLARGGGADYERWYTVEMMGERAGWMVSRQATDGARIVNSSRIRLGVKRGQIELNIEMESEFVETPDHRPVSMRNVQTLGAIPVVKVFTFGDGKVLESSRQGDGDEVQVEHPWPEGDWLTPAAASEHTRARLAAGDEKFSVRVLDPQNGPLPVTTTWEVLSRESIPCPRGPVETVKCRVTQSAVPFPSTEHLDRDGIPVRVETRIGAIGLLLREATEADARAGAGAPEVMVSTFVEPDRRIARPRHKKRAVYTLSVGEGQMPELPTGASQHVERIDERTVRVAVNVMDVPEAAPGDAERPEYAESSTMIGAADPVVAAMAAEGLRGAGDRSEARAEALRRHVHGAISAKSLGVGFATASETARTLEGDCSEHAVLLAAVLRAAGIPSRVAAGLIYADSFAGQQHIFGYHMWTQALVERDGALRWVDLDATLGETTFDATHIALSVSALSDGQTLESLAPMATLLGQLSIKVESAE